MDRTPSNSHLSKLATCQRHWCFLLIEDRMMMSRVVALLCGAFALAGCCMSGQGCYAPISTAPFAFEPSAPDGDAGLDAPKRKLAQKVAQKPAVQKLPIQDLSAQDLSAQGLSANGLPNATAAQRNA